MRTSSTVSSGASAMEPRSEVGSSSGTRSDPAPGPAIAKTSRRNWSRDNASMLFTISSKRNSLPAQGTDEHVRQSREYPIPVGKARDGAEIPSSPDYMAAFLMIR